MDAATAYLLATLTGSNAPVSPDVAWSTSTTLINSSTDAPVNSLAATVTAGTTYWLAAEVVYVTGASAGNPVFAFHGPAVSAAAVPCDFMSTNSGAVGSVKVLNGSLTANCTGPTMTSSDTCAFRASGLVTFSASGGLSLQAHTTSGSDPFTCEINSFLSLTPLP